MKKHMCPICGYEKLRDAPYDERGVGSDEICVCCGFQFGFDDFPDKDKAIKEWRNNWINGGCKWFSKKTERPKGWNPVAQLVCLKNQE